MDIPNTITSAIYLTTQICDYLKAVQDADDERYNLHAKISVLDAFLEILRSRITDSVDTSGLVQIGIKPALKICYVALQFIASKLNPESAASDRLGYKSEWPFHPEELSDALLKVERLKYLISLSLQTSLRGFMKEVQDDLLSVGVDDSAIEYKLSKLEKSQRDCMNSVQHDLRAPGLPIKYFASDIVRATRFMGKQTEFLAETKLQAFSGWLSKVDFESRQKNVLSTCTPGTGNWFLMEPIFQSWLRGDFNTLWCSGNLGVGKTVIASLVVSHLQEHFQSDNIVAVTCLFLHYQTHREVSGFQLLAALFKQLTQRHMTSESLKALEAYKQNRDFPMGKELLALLKAEINKYHTVFVVVDAIDEVSEKVRDQLLGYLLALSHDIRLIVTSREPFDVPDDFGDDFKLFKIIANEESMRRYVEERISDSEILTDNYRDQRLREELISTVVGKADGMFLAVRIQMDLLETNPTPSALHKTLNEFPKELLKTTYNEAMARMRPVVEKVAFQILSWLIHAKRPLTLLELRFALAMQQSEGMRKVDNIFLLHKSILSVWTGLVVLQDDDLLPNSQNHNNNRVVGFVHHTVHEYCLKNSDLSSRLPHPADRAVTCLQFLQFDIFDGPINSRDDRQRIQNTLFVDYAASHWGDHAREHIKDKRVHDLLTQFLQDSQRVETAAVLKMNAKNCNSLHLCAFFGLDDHFATLLSLDGADINAKDSNGDTPLTYALVNGRDSIVKLLFARDDIDLNSRGWKDAAGSSCSSRTGQVKFMA